MARRIGAVFVLAMEIASASYANIYGVCNYYGSSVHFTNTECSGNDCSAGPNGHCDAHRAFIPKCEDAGSYGGHHMNVRSDDGRVNWSIWKSDGPGKIRGGRDYGASVDMADEVSKGQWNIVIARDGGVSLYATADPNYCPPPPPAPCRANHVKGKWQYRYTIAGATTETWKHGTMKTHSESKTEEWSKSVSISVSEGFELDGESSSIKVDTSISHKVSQTYTNEWSVNDEVDFSVAFGSSDVGRAAWQFVFDEHDTCSHSERTVTREFALTATAASMPCCIPGYATDAPHYKTCVSHRAVVPGAHDCTVASEAASIMV